MLYHFNIVFTNEDDNEIFPVEARVDIASSHNQFACHLQLMNPVWCDPIHCVCVGGDGFTIPTKPPMALLSRPLSALIRKNALLKRRNVGKTIFELLFPVFMVGILVMNTFFWGRAPLPTISPPISFQNAFPDCKECMTLLVTPDTTAVDKVTTAVLKSLNELKATKEGAAKDVKITKKTFVDRKAMFDHIDGNPGKIGLGLVFTNLSFIPVINTLHPFVNYSIVSNASNIFGPTSDQAMASITLQSVVDSALFELGAGPTKNQTAVDFLSTLPAPFTNSLSPIWAYYIAWGFGTILKVMMNLLALDKENSTRVLIHSMGVGFGTYGEKVE
eukprot:TRINITY_DN3127_c1_g1_i2.p1 TRINITY_DN3127_c1_g1~~TRINITY_DN3127_c1_g1_i2.p1  ORF type:complete len:331 (+),score=59.09 TRINITY_DN3127_c1_g1_i2:720-1712(+)